jgi:hypothetical protein
MARINQPRYGKKSKDWAILSRDSKCRQGKAYESDATTGTARVLEYYPILDDELKVQSIPLAKALGSKSMVKLISQGKLPA